jgi:molybdopterin-synthase adenylyltransferase
MFTDTDRYSRQVLFAGIGLSGQAALKNSRVAIIGCGALGALHAETLARAGVGYLRIIDRDFVEPSNLARQIMFTEADALATLPKAIAAAQRIQAVNSSITVDPQVIDVNALNIENLVSDVDLILDGTDNFETRFLINDACVKQYKPWIYGAAVGSQAMTFTIRPGITACLRCVWETLPPPGSAPTCDTAGVILPIIAAISAWQTTAALKLLTHQADKLTNYLIEIDLWTNQFRQLSLAGLREQTDCRCCQHRQFDFLAGQQTTTTTTILCGRQAVQITPCASQKLNLAALATQLESQGSVAVNKFLLRFNPGKYQLTIFPDGRSIIQGTADLAIARSLYAKYVGN